MAAQTVKNHIKEGVLDFSYLARVFEFREELSKCSMVVHRETRKEIIDHTQIGR